MMGVFLKELRENLKWGAVICGVLLMFVCYEIRRAGPDFLYALGQGTMIFMAPLGGLVMGLAQSWFETKMDNWAFVVHRPVSRRGIFIAKCGAGLALLMAALAVPCLAAAAWAARPGNIAMAFQGRMVLPLLADVLLSGCYYFAGVVIILRRARWFGTRLLPAALPLACSAVVTTIVPEFWQAVALMLAVQGVGALAAWNVFSTGGEADQGGAPSIGLGAMIYAGALGVGFFLAGLPNLFYSSDAHWTTYEMDREGELLRIQWSIEPDKGRTSLVSDVTGKPLAAYEGMDLDDPGNSERLVRINSWLADEREITWPLSMFYTSGGFRNMSGGVMRLRSVAAPNVRLRFSSLYNLRRHLIELYDPVTHLLIGTVGPNGFAGVQDPPNEPFAGDLVNVSQVPSHMLAFPTVVYWMELDQRRVRPLFQTPADDPVFSAAEVGPQSNPTAFIATRQGIHVLRPSGEVICTLKMDLNPKKYFYQAAFLPANQHPVIYVGTIPGLRFEDVRNEYLEFDRDGTLVRETRVPWHSYPGGVKVPESAVFATIFPLWAVPVVPKWLIDMVVDLRTEQFAGMFRAYMFGSGAVCVLVTLVLARRYGFSISKGIAWAIGNVLLGPAGILVMVGLNEMPARERCAACGGKRLTGRRRCSACGAELEPTALNGREIFEPEETLQAVLV